MRHASIDRRSLLLGGASLAALWAAPGSAAGRELELTAAPARVSLVGPPHPDTDVWAYGGSVPGPEIRVRQGERLRVRFENGLTEDTTVHWHGLRVPNAMDGVPHLTQRPIAPGDSFIYEFVCADAGTFWYHPHQRSAVQVDRGLSGALIVEEREPSPFDRDVVWLLDDWRLLRDASISDDFGNMHDTSHAGRLGNTVTINGHTPGAFAVRAGERVRLRLINAANARIFGLEFQHHAPLVIAMDGQPVEPHAPADGRLIIGPGMRIDVMLDMVGAPGQRLQVNDRYYRSQEYRLLNLAYTDEPPLRDLSGAGPIRLAGNPVAEPDMSSAEKHLILLGGGMMGGMRSAFMDGNEADIRTLMHNGLMWAINGIAATGHVHEPLLTLSRNRSYVLELVNDTAWPHPMHLHGHVFRVISRNRQPTAHRPWQDTVLLDPRERVEIAFVADNPGDWMLHCHILEHQAGGMMGVVRVA